jgi:O-antigen ligase
MMAATKGAPKEYTLQPTWLERGAKTGALSSGWVRLHSVAGAAAWTFGYLFLATGALAVWAAWSGDAALQRFLLLAGGLVVSMLLLSLLARTAMATESAAAFRSYAWRVSLLMTVIAAAVAGLYIVASLGVAAAAPLLDRLPLLRLSDNEAAGALALLVPYGVALVVLGLRVRRIFGLILAAALLILCVAALALTGSRGAWLGVAAGAALALYLSWRFAARRGALGLLADLLVLAVVVVALGAWYAVAFGPTIEAGLGLVASGGSAASRTQLWRDTLPLLRDYWFTGSGLGNSAMIYSTYALLLHVPFLEHAHNLYLQVALEQGIVGMVAVVGMMAATLLRTAAAWGAAGRTQRLMLAAGVASVVALAVHGLFDAELYVSALAPLIFLAIAALYTSASLSGRDARKRGALVAGYRSDLRWVGVVVALLVAVSAALLLPGVTRTPAMLAANLGAVAQTRAELTAYMDPNKNSDEAFMQDAVRRYQSARLAPAVALFEEALESDPTNATAHRRLALIDLAQGEQASAKAHLEAAHAAQSMDRLPRQLLGEVAAMEGRPAEAARWWHGVDLSQGQLDVRQGWYQALGNTAQSGNFNAAIIEYRKLEAAQ